MMVEAIQTHEKVTSTLSGCSVDSGIGTMLSSAHLEAELKYVEKVGVDGQAQESCSCEESTFDPDLIIRVEGHLIPVHSSVISDYSITLRTMIRTVTSFDSERKPAAVLCLRGHSVENVNELLDYAYTPEKEIDGADVFYILRIAEDFAAEKLKRRCENFLISTDIYHPLDLIRTATKHNLKRLLTHSINKASKIPRVNCYADFDELEYSTRVKIMRTMEMDDTMNNNNIKSNKFIEEGYKSVEDETDRDDYDADSESELSD